MVNPKLIPYHASACLVAPCGSKADASGEIRASSNNVGDMEKFDVIRHEDGTASLRSVDLFYRKYVMGISAHRVPSSCVADASLLVVLTALAGRPPQ